MSKKRNRNNFSFFEEPKDVSEEIMEGEISFESPTGLALKKNDKVIDRIKEADHICQILKDCSNRLIRDRHEQIAEVQKFYPDFDNRNNVMLHNPHFGIKKFRYYGLERLVT